MYQCASVEMWPSDCCWPPWNKFVQVTAMSARASGKSLEKYHLHSQDEWQLSGYHWTGLPWIALTWLQRKELRHLVARSHIVQDRRRTESLTSSMLLWIACQEFRHASGEALDSLGPKVHSHPHHK